LDDLFLGDPAEGQPVDPRFREIASAVQGFSSAGELTVLNRAAHALPDGEAYLEVGTFKGRSLCGAAVGQPSCRMYAMENFTEFGMAGAEARSVLLTNLADHTNGCDVRLLEGDAFRMLTSGVVDQPVGVYFYDGAHTGEAHHLALALIEPLLADEAVVLIDDASWPMVERASLRFVAGHADWFHLRTFAARVNDDPAWANGLMLLGYRRSGAVPKISAQDRARLAFQVSVRGPAHATAWRTLQRFPGLIPLAKKIVPSRSRTISS
jgi:predicted O-methyltransferase YrrM